MDGQLNVQLNDYRKKKQIEYEKKIKMDNIRIKYSKLIILDKKTCAAFKITNFVKKYFIHEHLNMNIDIDDIPGIFRYHLKICLNDIYIWILIDLRIHGQIAPNYPIYIDNIEYILSVKEQEDVIDRWNRVNPNCTNGLRFQQYIDYSKTLANHYIKSL